MRFVYKTKTEIGNDATSNRNQNVTLKIKLRKLSLHVCIR